MKLPRLPLLVIALLSPSAWAISPFSEAWIGKTQTEFFRSVKWDGDFDYEKRREGIDDILNQLPPAEEWSGIRDELNERVNHLDDRNGIDAKRLQSVRWIFDFFENQKEKIVADLMAEWEQASGDQSKYQRIRYLEMMKELTPKNSRVGQLEIEQFIESLKEYEPIDRTALITELGGEAEVAALDAYFDAVKKMQSQVKQLMTQYSEDALAEKIEELQEQFSKDWDDRQGEIQKFWSNPLVNRYFMSQMNDSGPSYTPTVTVPDLVKLSDTDEAARLLTKCLRLKVQMAVSSEFKETRKLAVSLAIKNIKELKVPQWALVDSLEDMPLYVALLDRFPEAKSKERDYQFTSASRIYVGSLILDGKVDQAVDVACESIESDEDASRWDFYVDYSTREEIEKQHMTDRYWDYMSGLLTRHPELGLWDDFFARSAELGRESEALKLLTKLEETGQAQSMARLIYMYRMAVAKMNAGETDEALKGLIAVASSAENDRESRSTQKRAAETLLEFGTLLHRPDLEEIAFSCYSRNLPMEFKGDTYNVISDWSDYIEHLFDGGYYEKVLTACDQLIHLIDAQSVHDDSGSSFGEEYQLTNVVAQKFCALVELGHWQQAWSLLDDSPYWESATLGKLCDVSGFYGEKPFAWYAARVALQTDHRDIAIRVLEQALARAGGDDALYSLYVDTMGTSSIAYLDKLYSIDRYEERPLIWKAILRGRVGEWSEAEKLARQAIAVDPSDGEEGRGDRMRVYTVMADVMKSRGDAEQETFFRNVVKAIRMSEDADRWVEVGFYSKAIGMYREALTFFSDAYCVQSRLAINLAKEKKMDEAMVHYRKAYELMPSSFGRVESHCFGCERAFDGEAQQAVADATFRDILTKQPDNPQVHYLLGYLRMEQKRMTEAADYFREAVKLDPLYLNAWEKLGNLADSIEMSPTEFTEIVCRKIQLDPAQRHTYRDLSDQRINDWRKVMVSVQQARVAMQILPRSDDTIMELKATAAKRAKNGRGYDHQDLLNRDRNGLAQLLNDIRFLSELKSYWDTLSEKPLAEDNRDSEDEMVTPAESS